ncbi:MAG TPA: ubiquinol-cytochrome c reductase iron-sulfur subunit [Alphaproteobacteria bacterium]|nr:ubiquinol-cytochrome c reductase iron-sulfur subunit [Alphaproteobacteria bacterium]
MSQPSNPHIVTRSQDPDPERRDFIFIAAASMGAVGAGVAVWPFLASLGPAADTLALSTTEVDLSKVEQGQAITVIWRGKPVFIRNRTAQDIEAAEAVDKNASEFNSLRDQETDAQRTKQSAFGGKQLPNWLIMVGVCTHLGCIPMGQKPTDMKGDFGGWFCPCHGSNYDTAGRIRKGPAPKNLVIPPYAFLSETRIRIG